MTDTTDMTAEPLDYKDTLFLPKTDFPMRAGLPQREPEWLARWQRLRIVGVALTPEYVYEISGSDLFPDNRRFGVLWASRDALGPAFEMEGAFNDVGNLNSAFHLALIVPHRQPVTWEILNRLHTVSQRYVRMHLVPQGRVRRATREHNALYEAWARGEAREARQLTAQHIEETRDELAQYLA